MFFTRPFFNYTFTVLVFVCLNINNRNAYSQIYNTIPINHFDIETNPTILASESKANRLQIIHQNSFFTKNEFLYNSVRFSKYFESLFTGVGLSINSTIVEKNISYQHAGISIGYRNVLFNKVYLKIGITNKLIRINSPSGNFDYYSFENTNQKKEINIRNNLNLALSFSTSADKFFISLSSLNRKINSSMLNDSIKFPTYYVVNIGNLMSLFDMRNSEISYTFFTKSNHYTLNTSFSHYINCKLNKLISRKSGLQYGSRIGIEGNNYFHIIPFITYYTRKLAVNFFYNVHLDNTNFTAKYYSTNQINIIYIL
jgi:hypothetical protein